VREAVGEPSGISLGSEVGKWLGLGLGACDGALVGPFVGLNETVGVTDPVKVILPDGSTEGRSVGNVGLEVVGDWLGIVSALDTSASSEGLLVGEKVGSDVVGSDVGSAVRLGTTEGWTEGLHVGYDVVGSPEGTSLFASEGLELGLADAGLLGAIVCTLLGGELRLGAEVVDGELEGFEEGIELG
jgi:hypothetical protein